MKVVVILAVVVQLFATCEAMYACSQGATCADNQPLTFQIPGSNEVFCCEQAFDGYSVSISKLNDKVQAKCYCYTDFIG